MVRDIERFMRGFGPEQVPRYSAYRASTPIKLLKAFGTLVPKLSIRNALAGT
jgi:hypothetical protein